MTCTSSTTNAPDESRRAADLIDAWLALDPEAQDQQLARLIAAAVHGGPSSALERFAGDGLLDPEQALKELNHVRVPLEREAWVDALGRYILTGGSRP